MRIRLVTAVLLGVSTIAAIQGQVSRSADPQKLWALIIGVSNYAHAEPLQYAASDAQAFSDFLQSPRGGAFPGDHIVRLIEDQATRTAVLLALDSIQDKVQNGDTIYIYLAGHGYIRHRLGYFIPSDGDMRSAAASGVPFDQLKGMIESGLAHAGTRVLITDVCHAGRVGTEPTALAQKIENLINQEFLNLSGGGSRTFLNLLASRPAESSYERDDLGQGVFTHSVLEALNGSAASPGEPVVDAQKMVDYVRSEVPKFTAGQQHPVANQDYNPNLPLSFLDKPGPAAKLTLGGAVLEIINGDKSAYVRVQWVDPKTDALTVRQLPRDRSTVQIGSLIPGDLQLKFFDGENRVREASVKVGPGRNTLDLTSVQQGLGSSRGRLPGQLASLAPVLPSAAPPRPMAQAAAASGVPDAVLLMRLDPSTQVYLDGAYFGDSQGNNRYLQLAGLTPGIHKVRLVFPPEREQRFRVRLFTGAQILDPPSGELRFAADVPPPAEIIPVSPSLIPADARDTYNRFVRALWEERLIGPAGNSAWDSYQSLINRLPPGVRETVRDSLIVAMGNRAQRIILKYLRGGDIRWSASIFEEGAQLAGRVRELFNTRAFESQQSFFAGRALIERGQYPQAVQDLQHAIDLDPEAGYAYNAIGLAYWKQNLLDSAIPAFQQAIALSPRWTYPRITLALIYLEQRLYRESETTLRDALQIDGEDTAALNSLAQLHLLLGRLPDAEAEVLQAVDFGPGNAYAYETLGKIRQEQRRYPEAEQAYRLAIRIEPGEPSFRISLGELLRRVGRLQEVQQIFAGMADQYQDSLPFIQAYTGFLEEQQRAGEAETVFAQAVRSLPRNANLRVLYGSFLRKQGRDRDAERQLKAALQIAPGNAYAHYDLALINLGRKQVADAENEAALSIKADPRLAAPRKLLGQIRFAQKRFPEALQQFRDALALSIDANQQQELKEEIAKSEEELVRTQIESAGQYLDKRKYAEAWGGYCETLKTAPESQELRNAILQFYAAHAPAANLSLLPAGTVAAVMNTGFWKTQQQAEELWQKGQKPEALRTFTGALESLGSAELTAVASTGFNLGNESFGVHALVHRWALRMIEENDYRGALGLMGKAVQRMIFAPLPNFSPVTIESLMVRPDVPNPKSVADYDIAHHADRRAHEIFAAALAADGDAGGARKYLAAIEPDRPDLHARLLAARALQRRRQWTDAASFLKEGLERQRPSGQDELAADAYILLSEIQCQAGDCGAARETLQAAQKLLPGNKAIDNALKKLKF